MTAACGNQDCDGCEGRTVTIHLGDFTPRTSVLGKLNGDYDSMLYAASLLIEILKAKGIPLSEIEEGRRRRPLFNVANHVSVEVDKI